MKPPDSIESDDASRPTFEEDGWVYLYYAPPLDTPAGDAPNDGTAAQFEAWKGYNVLTRMKMVDDDLVPSTEQELLRVAADRSICVAADTSRASVTWHARRVDSASSGGQETLALQDR